MSKNPNRKPRSRWSCCFSIIGVAALLLIIAAGAFGWFYTHPISNVSLHTRVLNRLERISGLGVTYDSASLTIATGKYTITNLRFTDPNKPEIPVLSVGEVNATINPWQLISNPESVISHVVLKNPSRLDVVYSADSIKLGERSQFLVDAVKKAQPPGINQAGRLPFDELEIENSEISFSESEGILPDLAPSQAALIMSGHMSITNNGSSGLDVKFKGQAAKPLVPTAETTTATMAGGIEANVVLDSDDRIIAQGTIAQLAMDKIFRNLPETSVEAADLKFDFESSPSNGNRVIKGDVKAASLAYNSPEKQIRVNDENIDIQADLELQSSAGLVKMRSLALTSDGAKASVMGVLQYHEPRGYDLALSAKQLDQNYQALLEKLLPDGWDVQANQDSFAVDVHAVSTSGSLTSLEGAVALRNITLKTPALPSSLRHLQGDIQFSDDSISFAGITGEYGGAHLSLDGVYLGDPWRAEPGKLEMSWKAAVSLDEAIKLYQKQSPNAHLAFSGSGEITGQGTWRQEVSLLEPASSGTPQVEGAADFTNVSLQHPSLPAPIAGLSGKTKIVGSRLEVENLSGSMQGNELSVDGYVEGDTFFWKDSAVSATLNSRLDLAQIGPYLSTEQKASLDKYQVSGQASTRMLLSGPLSELGKQLTGVMRVSNVSLAPDLEFMEGKFSEVSGLVAWDGNTLRMDTLTGRLNNEEVQLSGYLTAQKIDINIKTQTSLEAVQKTFPRFDKYLEMSGGLTSDLKFSVGGDTPPAAGSLPDVLEAARLLMESAVQKKSYALNGTLKFKDASIRHIAMPIARTEDGKKIPAGRVTGLTGTVLVKNDTLTVPENATLSCAFSDTTKTRLSGSIKLRPDNFPSMKVKISSAGTMRLDTWATGWGKALPDLDTPPMTGKKFDFEADISAPAVVFRGQEAGRSQAKILFSMTQDKTPRVTELQNVVIQGNRPGLGRIIGNGRIESFVWSPQQFPRWETSLDVQSMPLESILTAVFREQPRLQGMITGNVSLQGIGNNARSVAGRGSGFMQNLEIGGTAVIRELGQTTGRNFGGKLFQTAQAATFEVGNGAISSRDLALDTNGLQLEMRGDYWFSGDPSKGIAPKTIDGTLRLRLFKSVFGSIPIIGAVADLADEISNALLLAFRISGSAEQPRITPVPLPLFQGGT